MNSKTKKRYTSQKGITLIALVITIIVLLILAGVTISMVLGDDGIIAQSQRAEQMNKEESINEQLELLRAGQTLEGYGLEDEITIEGGNSVIEYLKSKGIVKDNELTYDSNNNIIKYGDREFSLEGIVKQEELTPTATATPTEILQISDGVLTGFVEGEDVEDLIIPDGVTSIADFAFANNSTIKSVYIPNTVTSHGDYIFYDSSLTKAVIQEGVTTVGGWLFSTSSLTDLTLPSTLTRIPSALCQSCGGLTSIDIPENVTVIGDSAFSYTSLTSIELPGNLVTIEQYAFSNSDLTSVVIPASVTDIANTAFLDVDNNVMFTVGSEEVKEKLLTCIKTYGSVELTYFTDSQIVVDASVNN